MTEHTPTDEQMQADWHAYITTPDEENYYYDALSSEEADARWSRWLAAHDARVRRDSARGAIDGLIADRAHMTVLLHAEAGGDVEGVLTNYRDTHYPEETP